MVVRRSMRFRSTQIRLLAGLALFGLPVTTAAQDDQIQPADDAQTEKVVNCSRSGRIDASGTEAGFQASFEIENGVLRTRTDSPATASLRVQPDRLALGGGVTLAKEELMTETPEYETSYPYLDVTVSNDLDAPRELDLNVYFDEGVEVEPVELRVLRGRTTLATIESMGVSAVVSDDGNHVISIHYLFGNGDAQRWFRTPVTIELYQGGGILARMDFNPRLPSLEPFLVAQLAMLEGQPTDGEALPEGCTVGGGCFLTTATVSALGLPDNCWELRTLRRFRDALFLDGGDEAKRMIAEYYDQAPKVVAQVSRRSDARRIWLRAYWFGILPAAAAAQFGQRRVALTLYTLWTKRLGALAAAA